MPKEETVAETLGRLKDEGRTYNLWVAAVERAEGHPSWWTAPEIASFLDTPGYQDVKWRFFRNQDISVYQQMVKDIPLRTMFNFAKNLMRPIYTDFTETSENKDFAQISGKFYYQLFIQEHIYVSYKLFHNNKHVRIQTTDPQLQPQIDQMKRNKFDIWVKISGTEYDHDDDFLHQDTGLVVTIPNWRDHLASVKWGADYLDNFTNWMNIAITELTLTEFIKQAAKLVGTRVQITTDTDSTAERRKMSAMLESVQNIVYQNFDDKVDIAPIEFMTGQDLRELRDTIYFYLDRLKYEFGRVANTNPKGDRYSVSESYKDITGIANRQKETLENLIYFSYQAQDLWNIYTEFAISGIPEKEALYTVSHLAQNPNSEKEYFGQIEGTVPRRPIGQPGRRMSNNRSKMAKGKK